jgi:TRAP-type mannitol/chloroaromatic compound transport system permease small subunit
MSNPMSVLLAGIESLISIIGRATLWVALAMISLVALNVLLRYTFSFGSVWAQELEWHLLAGMILLGMSYPIQLGDNVRVDLFYAGFSAQKKFIVDLLSVLLILLVALIFLKLSLAYVGQSYAINEQSADPGGFRLRWVVKGLIPLGYGLLALQSVGALLRLLLDRSQAAESHHV